MSEAPPWLVAITCGPASLRWVRGLLGLPGVSVLLREDALPEGFVEGLPDDPRVLIHVRLLRSGADGLGAGGFGAGAGGLLGARRGLHLSGGEAVAPWRARWPGRRITRSAHSRAEAEAAIRAGADRVLLSPIWPPGSKPGDTRPPLGPEALRCGPGDPLAGRLIALGGLTPARAADAAALGAGAAAVGGIFFSGGDPLAAAAAFLAAMGQRPVPADA